MIWQDAVMTFGQLAFLAFLIPAMRSPEKPPLVTSAGTTLILLTYIPAQWTLNLYLTTLFTTFLATGWGIVAWQKWRHK